MVRVYRSTILPYPAPDIWAYIRDFANCHKWQPAVETSILENRTFADQLGAVRNMQLYIGEKLSEQLISLSDKEYFYRYTIINSEIPLFHYVSESRLYSVSDTQHTFWQWSGVFSTPDGDEQRLAELVGDRVYTAGFEAVRKHFAGV